MEKRGRGRPRNTKLEKRGRGRPRNTKLEKRGRGRPRKTIVSPKAKNLMNLSNKKVPYSDDLPEFFKIYIPALCSKIMRIPLDFIDRVGENVPAKWTLTGRPSGMSWQVGTSKMNNDWFFEKGWPEFVQENSLEEGDFMTFCFVGNWTFLVTIFSTNGCKLEDDHDTSSSDDETSESEDSEVNESKRVVLRRGSSLMGNERRNPSFEVKMMKSYINKGCLLVPMDFWKRYMRKSEEEEEGENSRKVNLMVKNVSWRVHLMFYDQHRRVVLQRGFPQFVKDNSLKVGTSCTFQLIDVNPFSFKVTIIR